MPAVPAPASKAISFLFGFTVVLLDRGSCSHVLVPSLKLPIFLPVRESSNLLLLFVDWSFLRSRLLARNVSVREGGHRVQIEA